ncbi:HAD-IIIC family phosphatase [Pikeienuella piscinae]|uniref:HAD-IIIC family phosphatase n=1 Tax=Pikeienuella piscinae TaxID=2748098 RepID=A0A7L5C111_9RHOB|nr:HAD-IIIC family phosphatase [Pikeienuella piscinae]QIE56808.1 HAD-IIIC family phosphatase [Pikeienuella piscinae]
MAEFSMEALSWLRRAPADFRREMRALGADEGRVAGGELADLANHALDLNQLLQFDRALNRITGRIDPGALSPMRLAVLADATTDFTVPAIRVSALRHGVLAEMFAPAYGAAVREAMNPASDLARFKADVALVARDHRGLGLNAPTMDPDAAEAAITAAIAETAGMIDGLERAGVRTVILQTAPIPAEPWSGHFDMRAPGSVPAQISAFNTRLRALADARAAVLLDADALSAAVGRGRWFDPLEWNRAKLPFSLDLTPLYADHVARVLGAIRGKARKCLVLDLDNTCWGGVIGDDGLEGVRVGQGSPEGEAFLAIQAQALALKARGVVLAVCSKNEEDAARLPFREHPDMLLREDDIAVFVANWTDKATNIRGIAKALNIGVDALVFLDDNPAERARVRQMLPEVAVPELPEDPAWYPAALAHAGYFETVGLSADDAKRAEQYRANAARVQEMEKIGDYDAYLASLDMVCDLRPFDEVGRTRIAQLINKSNQFNLTTRRYTEADVAEMQADPKIFDLQIRLTDRFGDNGMISVVIFRIGAEDWICDTWLMSCRVLGRRVEEAALAEVAAAARAAGAQRLIGDYIPSAKNKMVEGHFAALGFTECGATPGGGTRWALDLASFEAATPPMKIIGAERRTQIKT